MKVINLDMNTTVLRGSKQDAYKCVKESFAVLEAANLMVESLKDWKQSSNLTKEAYSGIQLMNAETLLSVLSTPAIDMYREGSLSKTPALFDRLSIFQVVRDQLVEILGDVVDAFVDLTDEEVMAIRELSVKILEQLSFFLFYEFNLDVTSVCIQKEEELEVNEAILEYVGKEGLNLEQKVLFMLELYIRYRPTIPSFDFTEEQIDMFYYHTGVVAHTILDNIDALEPNIVLKLASGEISPEEVVASISQVKGASKLDIFS